MFSQSTQRSHLSFTEQGNRRATRSRASLNFNLKLQPARPRAARPKRVAQPIRDRHTAHRPPTTVFPAARVNLADPILAELRDLNHRLDTLLAEAPKP